jgi:hypothetical protein
MNTLSDVERQLVMHGLDLKSRLAYSRTDQRTFQAACCRFAWKHIEIHTACTPPQTRDFESSRLLRHAPVHLDMLHHRTLQETQEHGNGKAVDETPADYPRMWLKMPPNPIVHIRLAEWNSTDTIKRVFQAAHPHLTSLTLSLLQYNTPAPNAKNGLLPEGNTILSMLPHTIRSLELQLGGYAYQDVWPIHQEAVARLPQLTHLHICNARLYHQSMDHTKFSVSFEMNTPLSALRNLSITHPTSNATVEVYRQHLPNCPNIETLNYFGGSTIFPYGQEWVQTQCKRAAQLTRLTHLRLMNIPNLEQWIPVVRAMPALSVLGIAPPSPCPTEFHETFQHFVGACPHLQVQLLG